MPDSKQDASLGDVIDFVKAYATQETLGPLKGAGRWLGFGAAAALSMGLGLMIMLLGLLRLVQTLIDEPGTGWWSLLAYGITLLVSVIVLVFTLLRIRESTLNKQPK